MSVTIDEFLREARSGLDRVPVERLWKEVDEGALLIDVRPLEKVERDGVLDGAIVIGLDVLEWRLAPSSPNRALEIEPDQRVILVCNEGYSSSLAAARLQALGIPGATDLIGGFTALKKFGG